MKNSIHFLLGLCFLAQVALNHRTYAQIQRCSTTEAEKIRADRYKFLPTEVEFERWMAHKLVERRNKLIPFRSSGVEDPDLIAVVVHVVYNEGQSIGEGVNITDEQIISQIEVLNEDYQRKNADTVNTQAEFLNVASCLNIQFVLARQDEEGNPTTGIVRVQGEKTSYNPLGLADRELLSSYSHWNPDLYLNIWVTNLRSPYIGLAQFPDHNLPGLEDETDKDNIATDGLVIDYQAFGSEAKVSGLDLLADYNLGRTATHEMGHFLGLKHVWGDGGCGMDDYVSDTPNSDIDYTGVCTPSSTQSCSSNDMFENFLYYTNDECMNIFTEGQVARMQIILDEAPRRNSLLNAIGTNFPDDLYVDLAVQSIESPGIVVCEDFYTPVVRVKNNGTVAIGSFDILYAAEGPALRFTYDGDSIFTAQEVDVVLPQTSTSTGVFNLEIQLDNVPEDVNPSNDSLDKVFIVDQQADFIPLREQFEVSDISSTNWLVLNEDDRITWELTNAPSVEASNSSAFINFYNYENRQQLDWLISPSLDFSGATDASVMFKTSYGKNQDFDDQLQILASADCGNSFFDILTVLNSEDMSVENTGDFWEPSGQNDWMEHTFDLGNYAGKADIRIAFLAKNDFGNNLYLDDIEFFATAEEDIVSLAEGTLRLYPNPSSDGQVQIAFNTSKRQNVEVLIYDGLGKMMVSMDYPNTLNQTYTYDLTGYRSGVYIVRTKGEDFFRSERLIISH